MQAANKQRKEETENDKSYIIIGIDTDCFGTYIWKSACQQ
jgi:hypothetical protein